MIFNLMLQVAMVVLAVVIVKFDSTILQQGQSEFSITELAHELLILGSMILIGFSAKSDLQARGFLVLVAGLFATMFIREADALFDNIRHGFWLYPALLVTLSSILYARKCTGTVKQPMLEYMESRQFAYITIGLIIIVVYSRTFGSGMLWRDIMADDYSIVYKTIIQEGIELLGYIFVFYGSILVRISTSRKSQSAN